MPHRSGRTAVSTRCRLTTVDPLEDESRSAGRWTDGRAALVTNVSVFHRVLHSESVFQNKGPSWSLGSSESSLGRAHSDS